MKLDVSQISFYHHNLSGVLLWLEKETGFEFIITSEWRTEGIHNTIPLQAVDLRCRNVELGKLISKIINGKFIYDPERPDKVVAIPHGEGSNFHIHVQVHENTVEK